MNYSNSLTLSYLTLEYNSIEIGETLSWLMQL
jgi:hypothetical protein